MKEQMNHFFSKVLLLICVMMLQACGSSSEEIVYSISADTTQVEFSNEFLQPSTDSIAINVTFDGEGVLVGFPPDTIPAGWLTYRAENVTATSATIHIDLIRADEIAAGNYDTKIRLTTTDSEAKASASHDIDIALLVWQLTPSREKISFSATADDKRVLNQSLTIFSESNEWTAKSDVDWLSLDTDSKTGTETIEITANTEDFSQVGITQGNIIITETSSGDSKSIPVELAFDNRYLFADTPVVAFSATNNMKKTEQTLHIQSNTQTPLPWQATTQANWLTLTKIDDNTLTINADENKAPANMTSSATIIIAPADNTLATQDTVTVHFYQESSAIENKNIEPLKVDDNALVASPALPLIYLAQGNELHTYHQYSGLLENTLSVSPSGTHLTQLIMHPAGDYLLAKAIETLTKEDGSTEDIINRYKITLADMSVSKFDNATIEFDPTRIVRLSGRYFVVTQAFEFADENLQVIPQSNTESFYAPVIDTAAKAKSLFALDYNQATLKRFTVQVNDYGDVSIKPTLTHQYRPDLLPENKFITDFMVSHDEKNIYTLSESSEWITFDGTDFTDQGLLETNPTIVSLHLLKSSHETPSYLRINPTTNEGFYLNNYNNQQTVISTLVTEGNQPSSIYLSGDKQRFILNSNLQSAPDSDARIELLSLID